MIITEAVLSIVLGMLFGGYVGFGFQHWFELGNWAWMTAASFGGLLAFLAYKPKGVWEAIFKVAQEMKAQIPSPSAVSSAVGHFFQEIGRILGGILLAALTISQMAIVITLSFTFVIPELQRPVNTHVLYGTFILSVALSAMSFGAHLAANSKMGFKEQLRLFSKYGNIVAWVCWVGKGALIVIEHRLKIGRFFLLCLKYMATHERLTVAMCAAVSASIFFLLGQKDLVEGAVVGAIAGILLLLASYQFSERFQE